MQSKFKDWGDVRIFLAVMREGSTLAASRVLGINQTTVARRIDVLEHAVGLTLFEKTTRGAKPTPSAIALLANAESLESSAKAFAKTAVKQRASQASVIRVTAITSAFTDGFTAILNEFTERHKNVRFSLLPSNEEADISSGDTDIAIRLANPNRHIDPSLICRRIFELRMSLFASRSYVEKLGRPASADDLAGHRLMAFDENLANHPANQWLLARVAEDQVIMTVRDILAMASNIKLGIGVGALPTRFQSGNPNLVKCFELPEGTGSIVWLLVNPTAYKRPEVKAFTKFFAPKYTEYYCNS
ncbi:LysR family transcriptional regulator [Thalassococcus sp. BH17M4-6]|uniref:LysR family transcriptional regulator n=1 Tax=Thalassococcus sp. BH17M4-6 TaxID=3413148 RepID=UPI003BF56FE5